MSTRVTHPTRLPTPSCGVAQRRTTTCCGFGLDWPIPPYYSARPENTAHCEAPDRVEGLPAKGRKGHDEGTGTPVRQPCATPSADSSRGTPQDGPHRDSHQVRQRHQRNRQRPRRQWQRKERERCEREDEGSRGLPPAESGREGHVAGPHHRAKVHPPRRPPV